MGFFIRNVTAGPATNVSIDDLGITVQVGIDYNILPLEPASVSTSTDLVAAIQAGNVVVLDPNDDSTPLSAADSEAAILASNLPHYRLSVGAFPDELPTTQIVRTTGLTDIPTTWTDFDFSSASFQNNTDVIEWSAGTPDNITVKEAGAYLITYYIQLDDEIQGRVRINDTTAILQSHGSYGNPDDTTDVDGFLQRFFTVQLSANDVLTLQIQAQTTAEDVLVYNGLSAAMSVTKLRGAKGDKGDTGAGSTISVEDDGTPATNTPHDTLNFGTGLTASDNGDGSVTITASSTSVYGTEFQENSSDGVSSTTSTTFQEKVSITTGSLPPGTYRIGWYFEHTADNTITESEVQIELNNTTVLSLTTEEFQDAVNWVGIGGFVYQSLSGVNTIDMDHRTTNGGTGVDIRRARLEIWRVS